MAHVIFYGGYFSVWLMLVLLLWNVSMLRNTRLLKFTRDGDDYRPWKQVSRQNEEESWHLQPWDEEHEEDENEHMT
ncbi:uncharacterized protein EV154DRAFT_561969 [Mucor mucedo]|uniref:uncharacterized protein n=1 Tax=Mucor mucedo TaxID=29922 RepID=UPI00221F4813|nr:uncharacterized protein EV154DRAFT_561969 [Mucor mucedo]KAI7892853.1 hypothetical protein EV154DRAFT_561969 [Mucor mucedo]